MLFHRRRRAPRVIALVAAFAVQIWSVVPVSASVIYCIGEDGHSGFELVGAGTRGCASCCHDGEEGTSAVRSGPASECTDIAIASATAVPGKLAAPADFVATGLTAALATAPPRHDSFFRRIAPSGGHSTTLDFLRPTVLLI